MVEDLGGGGGGRSHGTIEQEGRASGAIIRVRVGGRCPSAEGAGPGVGAPEPGPIHGSLKGSYGCNCSGSSS
jgi:hypothetical protein